MNTTSADRTNELLEQILGRLDRLEARIDAVAGPVAEAAPMVATTVDVADETLRELAARGIDVEARARAAFGLVEKVTAPEATAAAEQALDLALELPNTVATVVDIVDGAMRDLQARGVNVHERLTAAIDMLVTVTEPKTLAALGNLSRAFPTIEPYLEHIEELPNMVATVFDIGDEVMAAALAQGLDPEKLLKNGLFLTNRLVELLDRPEFLALLDSGVLSPRTLSVMSRVADALSESAEEPTGHIGPFGLIGTLRDRDVQTSLDFGIRVARKLGASLPECDGTRLLPGE